jgi:hypothetical protein
LSLSLPSIGFSGLEEEAKNNRQTLQALKELNEKRKVIQIVCLAALTPTKLVFDGAEKNTIHSLMVDLPN